MRLLTEPAKSNSQAAPDSPAAYERPTIKTLLSEGYDAQGGSPRCNYVIAYGPRAGSHYLARLLGAAGMGYPLEYFTPRIAEHLAQRWGCVDEPGAPEYVRILRQKRSCGEFFGFKIHYTEFKSLAHSAAIRELIANAHFVFLYREDWLEQAASYLAATRTGRYDFVDEAQFPATPFDIDDPLPLVDAMNKIMRSYAGWELFFTCAGINPCRITYETLTEQPRECVERIAQVLGADIDDSALSLAIRAERSGVYQPNRELKDRIISNARSRLGEAVFTYIRNAA